MKVYCEKCHEDLSPLVDRKFLEYANGKIVCPKCQKHQERYISESDLFLYLLIGEISYLILCGITVLLYLLFNKSSFVLLLLVPCLFLNFYILKECGRKIFVTGYPKINFKNYVFNEDSKAINTAVKYRVIIFFTISVSILTLSESKTYLLLYVGLSVIETFFRYLKSYKKERAIALSKINHF